MRYRFALFTLLVAPTFATAEEPSTPVESVVLRLIDEANAPAREAGTVVKLLEREGSKVRRGQLLALLDDSEAILAERAARLQMDIAEEKAGNDVSVRYAKKALEAAGAELRRSEESIAKFPKSVSQSQLDVERLTVQKMTLEQEQAEQELRLASLELRLRTADYEAEKVRRERRRIIAPIDGVVVEVAARLGEWVRPGHKVFRVVNTKRLKAEGFVSAESAAAGLQKRRVRLTVSIGGRDQEFIGRVAFVSPEVDPINNQVRLWAEIDNPTGVLRPGLRSKMVLLSASPREAAPSQNEP